MAWMFESNLVPSNLEDINNNNFYWNVLRSSKPWLIDFYAPWCNHCHMFRPKIEVVAKVSLSFFSCDDLTFFAVTAKILTTFTCTLYFLFLFWSLQKLKGRVNIGKVNCDRDQGLCQQVGLSGFPSIRLYRGIYPGQDAQVKL